MAREDQYRFQEPDHQPVPGWVPEFGIVPGELIRWQPNDRIRETRCYGETPDDFLGNSAEGDLIILVSVNL